MSDFSLSITKWYRQNARILPWRETNDPYLIWLSEIILQQTRVDQGLDYYNKFKKNYPTVHHLANATEQNVLRDWQGLGYYSRARNLHASAKMIVEQYNGRFPSSYDEIIKLKGVGEYTSAAISSFAFNEAKAVVDGNVYRLLSRVFDIDTPIDSTQGKKDFQSIANSLLNSEDPGTHNQAIMEVGALICTPKKPNCPECPLEETCLARSRNNFSERPIKTKKVKVTDRHFHFLIYTNGEDTIIEQRGENDIWRNMYQFPLIESKTIDPYKNKEKESRVIKHILSHQRIHATFHHFNYLPENMEDSWKLIKWKDLDDFPIPRLIDKYLENTDA